MLTLETILALALVCLLLAVANALAGPWWLAVVFALMAASTAKFVMGRRGSNDRSAASR